MLLNKDLMNNALINSVQINNDLTNINLINEILREYKSALLIQQTNE